VHLHQLRHVRRARKQSCCDIVLCMFTCRDMFGSTFASTMASLAVSRAVAAARTIHLVLRDDKLMHHSLVYNIAQMPGIKVMITAATIMLGAVQVHAMSADVGPCWQRGPATCHTTGHVQAM
jgi:hypothetical protein